ncbi:hypothetical protein ACFQZ2_21450, partial [Streptomonospora algeriensis]
MPSTDHEMPLEFLGNRPEPAAPLRERSFGAPHPDCDQTRPASGEYTGNRPQSGDAPGNAGTDRSARAAATQRAENERDHHSRPGPPPR